MVVIPRARELGGADSYLLHGMALLYFQISALINKIKRFSKM
jgi:hypothetical protein